MACHLPYLLPLLGLGLFWILPWQAALPTYLVLVGIAAIYGWVTIRTIRQPVKTGREAMVGEEGIVVREGPPAVVRVRNELWNARSDTPIASGEPVRVVGLEGLRLRVEPGRQGR